MSANWMPGFKRLSMPPCLTPIVSPQMKINPQELTSPVNILSRGINRDFICCYFVKRVNASLKWLFLNIILWADTDKDEWRVMGVISSSYHGMWYMIMGLIIFSQSGTWHHWPPRTVANRLVGHSCLQFIQYLLNVMENHYQPIWYYDSKGNYVEHIKC